jgi:hypothetical protein
MRSSKRCEIPRLASHRPLKKKEITNLNILVYVEAAGDKGSEFISWHEGL